AAGGLTGAGGGRDEERVGVRDRGGGFGVEAAEWLGGERRGGSVARRGGDVARMDVPGAVAEALVDRNDHGVGIGGRAGGGDGAVGAVASPGGELDAERA